MTDSVELRRRLADPATRTLAAVEAGDWARNLCLLFGASLDTAFFVGGAMARGLEKSWTEKESKVEDGTPTTL